jgi:hypothetical protein
MKTAAGFTVKARLSKTWGYNMFNTLAQYGFFILICTGIMLAGGLVLLPPYIKYLCDNRKTRKYYEQWRGKK